MISVRKLLQRAMLCIGLQVLHPTASRGDEAPASLASPDARFQIGELLFSDDFTQGTGQWTPEREKGGDVQAQDGKLIINVPAGCTLWFRPLVAGPVLIQYDATVISDAGPNDRVSDLNCFWMARDARAPDDIFRSRRGGQFAEYNWLRTYYVGLGGNENTTTRFRRYIGDAGQRPLLPEHDLCDPKHLIVPNVSQTLRLIACGSLIQFYRDGERIFELMDPDPYCSGWFAFRTVKSHLEIRKFRIYRLRPIPGSPAVSHPIEHDSTVGSHLSEEVETLPTR